MVWQNRKNEIFDFDRDSLSVVSDISGYSDNNYKCDNIFVTDQSGYEKEEPVSTKLVKLDLESPVKPLYPKKLAKFGYLAIIRECIRELGVTSIVHRSLINDVHPRETYYRTLEERFGRDVETNYDNFRINATYTNFHKFQKNAKTIMYVLMEVYEEMKKSENISTLTSFIDNELQMEEDEKNLLAEYKEKKNYLNTLYYALSTEKQEKIKELEEMGKSAKQADTLLKELQEYCRAQWIFNKKWEDSRLEQNSQVLRLKENCYVQKIRNNRENMNGENRCHQEIENYLLESKEDLTNEIQQWMDKYESEFEKKDNDIYNIKLEIDNMVEENDMLREKMEARKKEMDEWIEYKRLKAEEQKRIALENWAAIKIQAWWRDVMVRKMLGPYAKKKKAKGKGKNKIKKRKKKK